MHRGRQYVVMASLTLLGVALVVVGILGMTRTDRAPHAPDAPPLPDPSVSVPQQNEESDPLASSNAIEPSPETDTPGGQSLAASPETLRPRVPTLPIEDAGEGADGAADDGEEKDKKLLVELEACCKSGDLDGVKRIVSILENRSSLEYFSWLSLVPKRQLRPDSPRKVEVLGVLRKSAAVAFQPGMNTPPHEIKKRLLRFWMRADKEGSTIDPEWQARRRETVRLWLDTHEEITALVEPGWKYEEPEAVTGTETWTQRVARIQREKLAIEKRFMQRSLDRLRKENLFGTAVYIATVYSMEPLAPTELSRLLATLSDKELRQTIREEVARRTSGDLAP